MHSSVLSSPDDALPQANTATPTVLLVSPVPLSVSYNRPTNLPFRRLHMFFGIFHMILAVLSFTLEVITLTLDTPYPRFGAGIYCSFFLFAPGVLGLFAGKNNNMCCLIGCMVMNIIGTCVCAIGIAFTAVEMNYYESYLEFLEERVHFGFIYHKCVFMLTALIFEVFFTILHSSFTCVSCCYCCLPQKNLAAATNESSFPIALDYSTSDMRCCSCCYSGLAPSQPRQLITANIEGTHLLPPLSSQQQFQLGPIYQPNTTRSIPTSQPTHPPPTQTHNFQGHRSIDPSTQLPPSYADVTRFKMNRS